MKFEELQFDASGQSQELQGCYKATADGASQTEPVPYSFWIRRSKRYTFAAGRVSEDQYDEAERVEWVYWLIGEDGNILTAGLTQDGMMAALNARIGSGGESQESDDSYNRRTNYGAF